MSDSAHIHSLYLPLNQGGGEGTISASPEMSGVYIFLLQKVH